ncbi:MAG TPA: hypothetical protein VNU68_26910 [Verrucomicrobiae bacterium]|nr:hypothetical protein [Verrucomicrobiae bacterium]
MPFHTGAVLTALVSCLCRLTLAAGEPAYLPAVGPPPLRFAMPPAAPTVAVSLPPLPASASAPESVVAGDPAHPVAAATNAPEGKLVSPPESAPGPQPPGSNKPEEPPISSFLFPVPIDPQFPSAPLWQNDGSTSGITPDLYALMRFFVTRSTNNSPAVSIFGPVPFIPPAPRPPSSSASFETTPASSGKP